MHYCSGFDFALVRLLTINRLNTQASPPDPDIYKLPLLLFPNSIVHSGEELLLYNALGFIINSPHYGLGYFLDRGHITTIKLTT